MKKIKQIETKVHPSVLTYIFDVIEGHDIIKTIGNCTVFNKDESSVFVCCYKNEIGYLEKVEFVRHEGILVEEVVVLTLEFNKEALSLISELL